MKSNPSLTVEVHRSGVGQGVASPKQCIVSPKRRLGFQEGEEKQDILQVVRSKIADHGKCPLGRNSFHQRARHLPPMLALQQQQRQKHELAAKELRDKELLNSPVQSCPADSRTQSPDKEEHQEVVFTNRRTSSHGSSSKPQEPHPNGLTEFDAHPATVSRADAGGSDVGSDEESGLSSVSVELRDPFLCSGDLPEIFERSSLVPARESDSPFSSFLPLPSRHSNTEMLKASSALHEEGIRRLRRHEYALARVSMEMAWETMEDELAAADLGIARQFGILNAESTCRTEVPRQTSSSSSKSYLLEDRKRDSYDNQRKRDSAKYACRKAERMRLEWEHKISMGSDLILVYARLKMWEEVDDFCGNALQLWPLIAKLPHFESDEDELLWCQYMVRRAVACVHLGKCHFCRAEAYYVDVLKVMPSHRDAKNGLRCVRFLKSQMLPAEAQSSMLDSMSIN